MPRVFKLWILFTCVCIQALAVTVDQFELVKQLSPVTRLDSGLRIDVDAPTIEWSADELSEEPFSVGWEDDSSTEVEDPEDTLPQMMLEVDTFPLDLESCFSNPKYVGQGAYGQAWLAKDTANGNRLVVVKLFLYNHLKAGRPKPEDETENDFKTLTVWRYSCFTRLPTTTQTRILASMQKECEVAESIATRNLKDPRSNYFMKCLDDRSRGDRSDYMYLVLEYGGDTSFQTMAESADPRAFVSLLGQAIEGIDYLTTDFGMEGARVPASRHKFIHHDIKPDNIRVHRQDGGWKLKYIDLGAAVRCEGDNFKRAATYTPHYAPPELSAASTKKAISYHMAAHCSSFDMYAVGRTFLLALLPVTGRLSREKREEVYTRLDHLALTDDLSRFVSDFKAIALEVLATRPDAAANVASLHSFVERHGGFELLFQMTRKRAKQRINPATALQHSFFLQLMSEDLSGFAVVAHHKELGLHRVTWLPSASLKYQSTLPVSRVNFQITCVKDSFTNVKTFAACLRAVPTSFPLKECQSVRIDKAICYSEYPRFGCKSMFDPALPTVPYGIDKSGHSLTPLAEDFPQQILTTRSTDKEEQYYCITETRSQRCLTINDNVLHQGRTIGRKGRFMLVRTSLVDLVGGNPELIGPALLYNWGIRNEDRVFLATLPAPDVFMCLKAADDGSVALVPAVAITDCTPIIVKRKDEHLPGFLADLQSLSVEIDKGAKELIKILSTSTEGVCAQAVNCMKKEDGSCDPASVCDAMRDELTEVREHCEYVVTKAKKYSLRSKWTVVNIAVALSGRSRKQKRRAKALEDAAFCASLARRIEDKRTKQMFWPKNEQQVQVLRKLVSMQMDRSDYLAPDRHRVCAGLDDMTDFQNVIMLLDNTGRSSVVGKLNQLRANVLKLLGLHVQYVGWCHAHQFLLEKEKVTLELPTGYLGVSYTGPGLVVFRTPSTFMFRQSRPGDVDTNTLPPLNNGLPTDL
eukprot:GILJ01001510.1.p1 GENE.GILJ01001510.1~~GILJ01001510.1.p1  ORF type:complete len:977 (-),score=123.43 GILJ01001510.1:152-3082(-)